MLLLQQTDREIAFQNIVHKSGKALAVDKILQGDKTCCM